MQRWKPHLHTPRTAICCRLRDYREWIYLTSGIDMSYSPKAMEMQDHSMFDNVFVNPAAYRSFVATGTWPDKTVMVLEVRGAKTKGSINQRGHFQDTDIMGFEVHVKDERDSPASGPSSILTHRTRTAR